MTVAIDITGNVYGRLTAVKRVGMNKHGKATWLFRCSCGNSHEAVSGNVVHGTTSSCGCLKKEIHTTHGYSGTRLDKIYRHMVDRCYNHNNCCYSNYGERGIAICEEWLKDKSSFFRWAIGHRYSDEFSIDRINNNKGYSPDNCRWADNIVQANNTSRCIFVTINNKVKTIAEWARELNVPENTLRYRIKQGRNLFGSKQQAEICYSVVGN